MRETVTKAAQCILNSSALSSTDTQLVIHYHSRHTGPFIMPIIRSPDDSSCNNTLIYLFFSIIRNQDRWTAMEQSSSLVRNRKARHNYHILDTWEAGIVLVGTEVKSIRDRNVNFTDAYARVNNGELWLIGMHISPYERGTHFNHDPDRSRKLLMHAKEIERIRKSIEEQGLTLVPLSLYLKGGRVKVEIGLAKGKQLHDKRQDSSERDARREMDRAIKQRVRE